MPDLPFEFMDELTYFYDDYWYDVIYLGKHFDCEGYVLVTITDTKSFPRAWSYSYGATSGFTKDLKNKIHCFGITESLFWAKTNYLKRRG